MEKITKETEKNLEGIEGVTSAPETEEVAVEVEAETEVETPISLSTVIEPTEEEIEDAGLIETESDLIEEEIPVETETDAITTTTEVQEEKEEVQENPFSIDGSATKTFTQSQVDEIAGKTRVDTREKTFKYIYGRYGVNNEEELDELVGKAQRYELLQEEYDTARNDWKSQTTQRDQELASIKEQVALMQSGIDSERYEDAKLILKGKGLEVNLENIERELATHPEWKKVSAQDSEMDKGYVKTDRGSTIETPVVSKVSVLGNEVSGYDGENEEEYALNRIFKV